MKLLTQLICLFKGHKLILQSYKRNAATRYVKCLRCSEIWPVYK